MTGDPVVNSVLSRPKDFSDLQRLTIPPLYVVAGAPDNGRVLVDGTNHVFAIETKSCRETFRIFRSAGIVPDALRFRFEELNHVPCGLPKNINDWLGAEYKISSSTSDGPGQFTTIWCLFRDGDSVKLAASRIIFMAPGADLQPDRQCRYLLHVLLFQMQPIALGIPVESEVRDSKPKDLHPPPSAPDASPDETGESLPRLPKTLITTNVNQLIVTTDFGNFCSDTFTGFEPGTLPDTEPRLLDILKKAGYSRCSAPISEELLDIKGKYRLLRAKIQSDDGLIELECIYKQQRPGKPKGAQKIDLRRTSPVLSGKVKTTVDKPSKSFSQRMDQKNREAEIRECHSMLKSFIEIQNHALELTGDPGDTLEGKLPEIMAPKVVTSKESEKASGLSLGMVFLILILVAVAVVGGFYCWKHIRLHRSAGRVKRAPAHREQSEF
jgi:hypothetical protein